MRHAGLFGAVVAVSLSICACSSGEAYPEVFAHRGCWLKDYIPENSLEAVEMAARYGYPTTECDVRLTADSVHVLMHDSSINRTMRNASDCSEIAEKTLVRECSLEQLRSSFVLASRDSSRRVRIPTLEEYLLKCRECSIKPILHCDMFSGYKIAQKVLGSNWIAFTTEYDVLKKVREMNPEVLILYAIDALPKEFKADPANVVARLDSLGSPCGISSMSMSDTRAEMCAALAQKGYVVQSSIVPAPKDLQAVKEGCGILLTDFVWFQTAGRKPVDRLVLNPGKLDSGDEPVNVEWAEFEFGAIVVDFTGQGDFELEVNGKTYLVSHAEKTSASVGMRMFEEGASVVMKSLSDGGCLDKVRIRVYSL